MTVIENQESSVSLNYEEIWKAWLLNGVGHLIFFTAQIKVHMGTSLSEQGENVKILFVCTGKQRNHVCIIDDFAWTVIVTLGIVGGGEQNKIRIFLKICHLSIFCAVYLKF